MVDIFLSYAREDLAKARQLAAALEKQGWSVFWDRTSLLAGQDFDQVIEQAIEQARCMIVAWSAASKRSDWVRGEANIGRERKILVPVLFEAIEPPIAFRALHTENFAAWKGETDSSAYLALCNALTERIGPGKASTSSVNIASHQPAKKPEIRWSRQLAVKIGKIAVITATLAILLWFVVPVLLKQIEGFINSQATNADSKVTNQPLVNEPEIKALSANHKVTNQPPVKEPEIKASSTDPKVTDQPLIKEPEMLRIPAGTFQMGSNDGSDDEKPVHSVTLKSFAIGRYEVTFDEYDQFAEATGKSKPDDVGWGRGKRPVINVSWDDAVAYTHWLSKETGKHFRLPTEAEWEYAARAKTTSAYYWNGQADAFAWFSKNSAGKTHPVGELKPNAFRLYDMSGNVWEWVQDCYQENYNQAPKDGTAWELQNCPRRVVRGGSWNFHDPDRLRSAYRLWNYPDYRTNYIGFRLAQD